MALKRFVKNLANNDDGGGFAEGPEIIIMFVFWFRDRLYDSDLTAC